MKSTLYVGTRKGLDKWMYDNDVNPTEHGRSVRWAANGPNHLKFEDAPFRIVEPEDWYERTIWDEMSIKTARDLNAIVRHDQRRRTRT